MRKTPVPAGKKKRVLIINHVFEQDIEALEKANTSFDFIIMSAFVLRNVGTLFFPPQVESYIFFNKQSLGPLKKRYEKIIDRFIDRLIKKYDVAAVVSPSDNFFYVRQIVLSFQKRHIPFIVVDKEGTICPAYFVHFAQYIHDRCPLLADAILVWSERQKAFWEKTGVASKKITVTGQPRSDFWKQPERWLSRESLGIEGLRQNVPLVLFFTYDPWAYTPDYMVERKEMHWESLRLETHTAIYTFAKLHPEVDIVIKAHPQQLDFKDIQHEINQQQVHNVFLTRSHTLSNHLIIHAKCIIGFQTTALIESMITNTPILYTFWGEAKDKWANDLIPFHLTSGVRTVTSAHELVKHIEHAVNSSPITSEQRAARDEFIHEYLSSVDGHASQRVLQKINEILSRTL